MAILKELDSNYGINPTYHRVVCVSINALRREVTICLASYFSKEIRDNGGQPIETIDINVPRILIPKTKAIGKKQKHGQAYISPLTKQHGMKTSN